MGGRGVICPSFPPEITDREIWTAASPGEAEEGRPVILAERPLIITRGRNPAG